MGFKVKFEIYIKVTFCSRPEAILHSAKDNTRLTKAGL